jgi:hypothetical protein
VRPAFLLPAAALCLLLAVWLTPPVPAADTGVLGAVGRSVGGARIFAIDALFLRAEAQRKAGRAEEAAALYETALEMDPANEAATIFLVNVIADELMAQQPDQDARLHWWLRARRLLDRALKRNPTSPSLHARAASLILEARLAGGPIRLSDGAAVMAGQVAYEHLLVAARQTATLPRLGRSHLVQLALLAPEVAAEALAHGDPARARAAVAAGREILILRGAVLRSVRPEEDEASLADILTAGLDAVEAVQASREGQGEPSRARTLIENCRALVPGWNLPGALEALL